MTRAFHLPRSRVRPLDHVDAAVDTSGVGSLRPTNVCRREVYKLLCFSGTASVLECYHDRVRMVADYEYAATNCRKLSGKDVCTVAKMIEYSRLEATGTQTARS